MPEGSDCGAAERALFEGARFKFPMDVGTGAAVRGRGPGALGLEVAARGGTVSVAAAAAAAAEAAPDRDGPRCREAARCMSLCVSGCSTRAVLSAVVLW